MRYFGVVNLLIGLTQTFVGLGLIFKVLPSLGVIYNDLSIEASPYRQGSYLVAFLILIWGIFSLFIALKLFKGRSVAPIFKVFAIANLFLVAVVGNYLYRQIISSVVYPINALNGAF